MTRNLTSLHAGFPDPAAAPDGCADLLARWAAVLDRAPRLRPWLSGMIAQRRAFLCESAVDTAAANVERALWADLERWVVQFEALPRFAVSAIATTLQETRAARSEPEPQPPAAGTAESPERALDDLESLLGDPVFALAFHCVETRVRPALPGLIPDWAWFGLLHASAAPRPLLTPDVAVTLVLRVRSGEWPRLPALARAAALRLFHASLADLRAAAAIERLRAQLPWPVDAAAFVAAARPLGAALGEACDLCARIAAAVKTRRGSFSVLQPV
ncbi:MAG TPA: hypothetical protein VFP52_04845, partial [Myxococcales bacterium]|nr:hypothetical protein [Myxococcales bacterium]